MGHQVPAVSYTHLDVYKRQGLDRYIGGEEGVATLREQVIKHDDAIEEFSGINYHLGISFAQGLDGTKRSFAEVHELSLIHI